MRGPWNSCPNEDGGSIVQMKKSEGRGDMMCISEEAEDKSMINEEARESCRFYGYQRRSRG